MHDTRLLLANGDFPAIFRKPLEILQVNLGYLCNLSCIYCHVNAGSKRTEMMSLKTLEQVLALAHGLIFVNRWRPGNAPAFPSLFIVLRTATIYAFLKALIPALFRRERGGKSQSVPVLSIYTMQKTRV